MISALIYQTFNLLRECAFIYTIFLKVDMFLESLLLMLKLVHLIKSKKITINYVDVICLETRVVMKMVFKLNLVFHNY